MTRLLHTGIAKGRAAAWRPALAVLGLVMIAAGCGSRRAQAPEHPLASAQVKKWLQQALPSVLGVSAVYHYQITNFHHELVNGKLQPDAASPTGYRLRSPHGAVPAREMDMQKINGGGVIIYRDRHQAVVLTSAHIFNKPDTILHYDRTDTGSGRRLLLARAVQKSKSYYVINPSSQYLGAEIWYRDQRADLALLAIEASELTMSFPFALAAPGEIEWGDLVYVIGYPREVKQLSTGVVSRVPYPGSFILDTVARFGFSGGPVFIIRPEKGLELAGIIRGVPATRLRYVAPPKDMPPNQVLDKEDLQELAAQEVDLIDYGTTYAVGIDAVTKFLREAKETLQQKGVVLDSKYTRE